VIVWARARRLTKIFNGFQPIHEIQSAAVLLCNRSRAAKNGQAIQPIILGILRWENRQIRDGLRAK
jgi:hypothetical protein